MNENEAYHADTTRVSKSGLDKIHKAPAYYHERYLNPDRAPEKRTAALVDGAAFHTVTLEGDKFKDEFVIQPKFSGTGSQAARDGFIASNQGKDIIDMETYNSVSRMRDAVMAHPIASELLSSGMVEKRLDWDEPISEAPCKIKPDFISTGKGNVIVDLKSTEDASSEAFGRSAYTYRYHVQAPFYVDGAAQNGIKAEAFVFIAVEKSPPYLVNVFFATADSMDLGRREYIDDCKVYQECKRTGIWQGYSQEIKPLNLPGWTQNL